MRPYARIVTLAILIMVFVLARASGQQPQTPSAPAQDQSQPAERPPHVDAEPDPKSRNLEKTIKDALQQDPHMAYSNISVHADDQEVILSGTVASETAKKQAEQIATDHAAGRKITDLIKVNTSTHYH
jgi:osmotically-inducible protein OsmY